MKRLSLFALFGALPFAASAQVTLFSDNFDADHTANWQFNSATTGDLPKNGLNNEADFFFDYSTIGIASANGAGGTTRGLKLESNVFGSTAGDYTKVGVSVSPIGKSFTGDYTLSFDAWLNFQGPMPGGGNGTTQAMLAGVGGRTSVTQFPGTTVDGVGFAATGDGGANQDYRAYTAAGSPLAETSGAYAAGNAVGSTNNTNTYYSGFRGAVPQAQTDVANALGFNKQTGQTNVGALGMAWHKWEIAKSGNTVTWKVDNLLIATATKTTFAGNNIFLGYFDTNASISSDAVSRQLLFGLVDNVKVTAVPEPATMAALGLGMAAMLRRRKKA